MPVFKPKYFDNKRPSTACMLMIVAFMEEIRRVVLEDKDMEFQKE